MAKCDIQKEEELNPRRHQFQVREAHVAPFFFVQLARALVFGFRVELYADYHVKKEICERIHVSLAVSVFSTLIFHFGYLGSVRVISHSFR
jgi:ABC-type microcin C transport system permease subunit YejB